MIMREYIRINLEDNVVVALKDYNCDDTLEIDNETIEIKSEIKAGHKILIKDLKAGDNIIKYGNPIGYALVDIQKGEHIHNHNIKTNLNDLVEYNYEPKLKSQSELLNGYFKGYVREDGNVGIRNELWIIPTVGCVNGIVREIEREAQDLIVDNVDGIVAFNHPYGCSQIGDDEDNTRTILSDLITHPNAGGVLVVGLGCENSNITELKKKLSNINEERIKFINCQDYDNEVEQALVLIKEILMVMKNDQRTEVEISKLKVGLKCGGSDGFSGITANPVVGKFSDILINYGGTTILTEVPEMFGAEKILMNRCVDYNTFEKTVKLINDYKNYYKSHNQPIYENPSPGNKKGGISTLEDKSLGCIQKSGNSNVCDVLNYGEKIKVNGLNLLSSPGNDLVAATALAASGCQLVLFTTGRGTPFACPVPTIKIASNNGLYERKNAWIDFNAGVVINNSELDDCGRELFEFVLEVASGKKTKSEISGYHDLAIFKTGVTL